MLSLVKSSYRNILIVRFNSLTKHSFGESELERRSFLLNENYESLKNSMSQSFQYREQSLYRSLPKDLISQNRIHLHSMPPIEAALTSRFIYGAQNANKVLSAYSLDNGSRRDMMNLRDRSMGLQGLLQSDLKQIGEIGDMIASVINFMQRGSSALSPSEQMLLLLNGTAGHCWNGSNRELDVHDKEVYLKDAIHLISQLPAMAYFCTRGDCTMSGDQSLALSNRDWAARLTSALGGHTSLSRNLMRICSVLWLRLTSVESLYTGDELIINRGPLNINLRKRFLLAMLRMAFESEMPGFRKNAMGMILTNDNAELAISSFRDQLSTLGFEEISCRSLKTTTHLELACHDAMIQSGFPESKEIQRLALNIMRCLPFICDVVGWRFAESYIQ